MLFKIFNSLRNVFHYIVECREISVKKDIERLEKMGTFRHYNYRKSD